MDKRTLSKVPREEATPELMELANQLKDIRHIVTARMIEDNKILLLNFYEVSKLKQGNTAAVLRTFLSEDDYITQNLKESKVKWLTASFYNMDEINFRDSYYNGKTKEYESKERVLIRTEAEKKLIGDFFKKYETEIHDRYYWWRPYPYPWESVRQFQNAVLEQRLEEKHNKELKKIDEAMEPFKEPPQAFFDWVWETGMRFSRYVIYKEVKSGKAECECTHCGTVGMVSRSKYRLRNNEKGECPFCGSRVTYKAKGKLAYQTNDVRWFIYVDPTADGFALRYFYAARTLKNDGAIQCAICKTRIEEFIHESKRAVYTFPKGKTVNTDYEWNVYKQRGLPRWCPSTGKYAWIEQILYPGNLPEAWAHTPMKYSALEVLATNIPTVALNYERGIRVYQEFPKLEWLCKMGLNNLAKFVIENKGYNALGKMNYEGKTIYEILWLTKVNIKLMQEIDGTNEEQRLLQVAQKIGLQFKPEQLREYYRVFKCNTELLQQANRKTSLHKLVRYIERESERYPMGERGGCWRYAYRRYTEREDPRIERQQNMAKDWIEYLKWCEELHYDLNNMFIYMPKNFKAVHDRTAAEYQALKNKRAAEKKAREEREAKRKMAETKKAMEEIFSHSEGADAFSIRGKGLIMVVPKSGDDIRNEGATLHHCVGGYVEKVAQGKTCIFFIRKAEEPDTPYYTMEWRDNRIIQCRGMRNCGMTPEVKAFTKVFEQKMLASIEKSKGENKNGRTKQNLQYA